MEPITQEQAYTMLWEEYQSALDENKRVHAENNELKVHLNTRNLSVERDGDPLREKLKELLDGYFNNTVLYGCAEDKSDLEKYWLERTQTLREELDARLSGLVDIIRVLTRDNKAQQVDLRRYKAALEQWPVLVEEWKHGDEDQPVMDRIVELAKQALEGDPE